MQFINCLFLFWFQVVCSIHRNQLKLIVIIITLVINKVLKSINHGWKYLESAEDIREMS